MVSTNSNHISTFPINPQPPNSTAAPTMNPDNDDVDSYFSSSSSNSSCTSADDDERLHSLANMASISLLYHCTPSHNDDFDSLFSSLFPTVDACCVALATSSSSFQNHYTPASPTSTLDTIPTVPGHEEEVEREAGADQPCESSHVSTEWRLLHSRLQSPPPQDINSTTITTTITLPLASMHSLVASQRTAYPLTAQSSTISTIRTYPLGLPGDRPNIGAITFGGLIPTGGTTEKEQFFCHLLYKYIHHHTKNQWETTVLTSPPISVLKKIFSSPPRSSTTTTATETTTPTARTSTSTITSTTVFTGFDDPYLEHAFKAWYTATQCALDVQISTVHALTLILVSVVALAHGMPSSMAIALTLQSGLCCILPWASNRLFGKEGYRQYRTALVVTVRVAGTCLLLLHWLMNQRLYASSGSVVAKGVVGSAVGRLALGGVHTKVRWWPCVGALLGELYAAALADAIVFSSSSSSSSLQKQQVIDGGLGLGATAMAQLAAAFLNALSTYFVEKRARHVFLKEL